MDVKKIFFSAVLAALISFNICHAEKILADTSDKSDPYFLALVQNDNDTLLFSIYNRGGYEMAFIPYDKAALQFLLETIPRNF